MYGAACLCAQLLVRFLPRPIPLHRFLLSSDSPTHDLPRSTPRHMTCLVRFPHTRFLLSSDSPTSVLASSDSPTHDSCLVRFPYADSCSRPILQHTTLTSSDSPTPILTSSDSLTPILALVRYPRCSDSGNKGFHDGA